MAHLQYMPGDPRLVDQLVYELKSKGIFDQFRKDCISDVDTRPAYQNLRQRVESSVALFLARQPWKADLNKNQLREKLRKHILDGNYLEQGVERIVDQVVNPKVASVFIPQVEDLVYNYLGITRKKTAPETATDKGNASTDLLPNDLEAVSPGSVKSNDDKDVSMEEIKEEGMETEAEAEVKPQDVNDITMPSEAEDKEGDTQLSGISDLTSHDSEVSLGKLSIPMPADDINLENIPSPENSPPKIDLDSIEMPKEEPIELKDIPLPEDSPKDEKDQYFKPVNSEDDSSSDSSIIRNMSPLTPIRNFNNENSCDAQQAFENDSDIKTEEKKEPNTFRFTIEAKSSENSSDNIKEPKVEKEEPTDLAYQFNEQVNINTFNTPMFDDSSNSHNLQIDYESDVNSKTNLDKIPFPDDPNSEDSKKESTEEKKSHKSSRSRDSHRHSSSSKDRRSDSKHSSSKDRKDSKHDKKTTKDDQSKSKSSSDKSKERADRKDSKDSKHRSSSSKDSKHRSSSSSQRHSSSSKHDDKKSSSSSNNKDKEKTDKNSKEHRSSKDSKSRSDKDKKTKKDDKDKDKKDKKDDDHYSASGRGNVTRRSTDRDSNDGSSSSKGSQNQSSSKSSESKTNKDSSSKSDNTPPSSNSTSPSEKDVVPEQGSQANISQYKPIVRVDTHLETPRATPPRLPFVPDVTLKKPRFAANLEEAKRLMKMRKFLDEEQKRMNQEAALLLEFQANVRPSLSQVYSSIPGPELEFACISNVVEPANPIIETNYAEVHQIEEIAVPDTIEMELTEMNKETKEIVQTDIAETEFYAPIEYKAGFEDSEKILNEISKKVYGVVDDGIGDKAEEIKELELKSSEEVIMEGIRNEQSKFEAMLVNEEIKENEAMEETFVVKDEEKQEIVSVEERPLEYFAEHEKYDAELERIKFERFLEEYLTIKVTDKLYLINCDPYEESIIKEVAETFGQFQIINCHQNGCKNKNIVKNVNVSNEIVLPMDRHTPITQNSPISQVLSPVKSECSFELTSDYDAKLEEMVNKTSRQEIMEIILGGGLPDESPSKMPQIDYYMDDNLRADDLKRKMSVESVESTDNNNGHVLTPCKMRKLSDSDQISSTTEETPNHENRSNFVRSKYLGRARRVGLPRPRRTVHPNSPSSDKSVENYDTNDSGASPRIGKRTAQRKVQRYDTADLYKPKLHYLSRRNNIS